MIQRQHFKGNYIIPSSIPLHLFNISYRNLSHLYIAYNLFVMIREKYNSFGWPNLISQDELLIELFFGFI